MAHCGLGSIPGCHMWVEFVVGSRPCSKDSSFSESSGFPPSAKKNKPTNKQKTKKKQSKFDLEAEDKKDHLVEWPLLNSHSPSHYSRCFQSCVHQLRFLVDSNGRTACNHKGGRGLGPETEPQTVLSSPALSLLWPAHYKQYNTKCLVM